MTFPLLHVVLEALLVMHLEQVGLGVGGGELYRGGGRATSRRDEEVRVRMALVWVSEDRTFGMLVWEGVVLVGVGFYPLTLELDSVAIALVLLLGLILVPLTLGLLSLLVDEVVVLRGEV